MKHIDFIHKIPGLINHKTWGIQYLETDTNSSGVKACYRSDDYQASFGTYGKNWQDVYDSLSEHLKESDLLN